MIICILLLLAFTTVRADTIELKTGEKIEGRFKQATEAGAVIEVGGQTLTLPLDKVRMIVFRNVSGRIDANLHRFRRAGRAEGGSGSCYPRNLIP